MVVFDGQPQIPQGIHKARVALVALHIVILEKTRDVGMALGGQIGYQLPAAPIVVIRNV